MKLRLAMLLCALAAMVFAADVTGKWTFEQQGRQGNTTTVTMNLKADGSNLTGTVSGGRGGDVQISDGKVDGSNVSFNVVREFQGNSFTTKYSGTVSGDELKLKIEIVGRDMPAREVTAKRVSST